MHIAKKLTLSFVALTAIIILVTLTVSRWSIEQGFDEFLQSKETERLERINQDIQFEYLAKYDSITQIPAEVLAQILQDNTPGPRGTRPPEGMGLPNQRFAGNRPLNPPPKTLMDVDSSRLQTALLDLNRQPIAGDDVISNVASSPQYFELVIVYQNQPIGILISWTNTRLRSATETAFLERQFMMIALNGMIGLIIAVAISIYLTRWLLDPVHKIIEQVDRLSKGNYKDRLICDRQDEYGQLQRNINHLAHTLEQTQSAKNRWFADISHELRTPLTVLMGELEALQLGIRPFNAQQLASLQEEANLLNRLINDLYQLSMSDIGALRYQFTPFNISDLLMGIVQHSQTTTYQKGLSLHHIIEPDVFFNGDQKRIRQLFTNIINNAIAYTDPHPAGEISVMLSQSDDNLHICIEDSAPGLSVEECSRIFTPLYRHDKARNRNNGGAGLGLAICLNIVTAHNGHITAQPSPLGGINIRVTLPLERG